jgi:hypothetical protein
VLARSDLFPDALAGVPLVAASAGPLLISRRLNWTAGWLPRSSGFCPWTSRSTCWAARERCLRRSRTRSRHSATTPLPGWRALTASPLASDRHPGGASSGRTAVRRCCRDRPDFPDALAAGAAAGLGGVVVLSNDAALPPSVRDYVVDNQQVDNALVATVGAGGAVLPLRRTWPSLVSTATRPPPSWPMSSSSSPGVRVRCSQGWRREPTSRTLSVVARSWHPRWADAPHDAHHPQRTPGDVPHPEPGHDPRRFHLR